ncbi:tRNA lysidine(34) synthetase TilS [Labrys wisconsinensis]|uniref:tRNA(Ile)-lysidine synthase n=1 Tax=Labrys wisconsinensis TaxID=425677 RepID=A0ABU0JJI7_9HYPH|nr:tRNA lysidine(34) synthetase TilS [Labrys wisconsinensis]MDQ0474447.1 tRNA(Ile)-lysidine synthase [Labrys wisconsinensis]
MAPTGAAAPAGAAIADPELDALLRGFEARPGLVLAVSGGADSTALMLLAARWRALGGATPIIVGTVDHGLRAEAAAECEAVAAQAARLALPCRILRWAAARPASRLQERARAARYALLAGLAREVGADALATAHTLDDQAETVLMRLARGSGIDGLAAMRPSTPRLGLTHLRPLLACPRAGLVATLREAGLSWVEDPSNADPRFERVRARRLLAGLAGAGLTAPRLAVLAARAGRAAEALDRTARALFAEIVSADGTGLRIAAAGFAAAAPELRLRLIALAAEAVAPAATDEAYPPRLERLEALGAAIEVARAAGRPLRRSFAGAVLGLDRSGALAVAAEGPRRRGSAVNAAVRRT